MFRHYPLGVKSLSVFEGRKLLAYFSAHWHSNHGGKALQAGDVFYMNAVRISPRAVTPSDERLGGGYGMDTLAPYCGLKEMDRLAECILGK